ncbi:MAG: hypothetical protein IJJ42_02205 [Clostridia bacterium]|nr:hypothetical protein [Clostridia bacterium]
MIRRLVLLTAALMLMVTFAAAESASMELFAQIEGQVFEFYSGAGGWSTELTVGENGTFTGNFHDSEMGETDENYPDGTLYGCSFHGQFSDPEPVDENAWTVKLTVEQDEGQVPEAIEDGIRYVTAAPYGLEKAQTVTVFLPGTPVDCLPEDFMIWSHLQETTPDAKVIPYYAIWNEADEAGFIAGGWDVVGSASAEPAVVTALASEINPDRLASVAFDAKINSCADGVFSITVLVPERYDPEEIKALKAGDSIFTEGREVKIRSITNQDGYIILNADTEDEVCLYESIDTSYWIADDNDNTWAEFPSVTVQASEHFIFLDGINPSTGEALLHPTVHNMAGFLERMNSTDDSGFDIRNTEAVIDEDGKLAVIQRFYVPWQ